ncbi:AAA family ATPase [Streptomyces pacificus]|uniref:AAA family ATPase n=1 Tax=Streptomyces pacificus TaxID=2705029 RepID=UPI0020B157C3|nr:AAA family ATPase [Streptomyces pacificus]
MAKRTPVVFLLEGLTGSGKTIYAQRKLEPQGVVRLSVDEVVHRRHGRYGVDYPENTYFVKEAPVVAELHERLAESWSPRAGMWCGTTGCGCVRTATR